MSHNLHMAKLMGDGEGGAEAVVLDDSAAVLAAHCPQFGQTESVTVLI